MICCLGLMSGLGVHTWERLFIWLAIGLVIYFAYGRFHSTVRTQNTAA
jgi:APA family basic amino acid/polyamine antiporter